MKRIVSSLALAMGMLASSAFAATTTYRAVASGPSEVTPNASPGYTIATIVIDDTAGTMQVTSPFQDLLGTTTGAHIHCCTAAPFVGGAGVATPFTDFPLGVMDGTYSHLFDLNNAATYGAGFYMAAGSTVDGARDTLLTGIGAHEAYLNIHTNLYPGGEIRGFLVAMPVPEPSQYAMLGLGLAGVAFMARRKKAK